MAQQVSSDCRAFTAGAAIAQYLRVKLSSGKLALAGAGATDGALELGTMETPSFADGDVASVRLKSASGTRKCVAAGAISAGAVFYGAANGKISATVSGVPAGVALEASSADGDVIEVLYFNYANNA